MLCLHSLVLLGFAEIGKVFRLKDWFHKKNINKAEPHRFVLAAFNDTFSAKNIFINLLIPCCISKGFSWYIKFV